jgi:predicted nucleic acid-binding protein
MSRDERRRHIRVARVFRRWPQCWAFAALIEDVEELIVLTICLSEVFKVTLRERGEDAALQAVALMEQGQVVELTETLAIQAANVSTDLKLPMAGSIILATARACVGIVSTQDGDFDGIEGVTYIAKSGSFL